MFSTAMIRQDLAHHGAASNLQFNEYIRYQKNISDFVITVGYVSSLPYCITITVAHLYLRSIFFLFEVTVFTRQFHIKKVRNSFWVIFTGLNSNYLGSGVSVKVQG